MIFSTCPTCEIDRLTQHKRILLELIREGMSVGYSVSAFVKWQKRAEFIIRNEGPLPETESLDNWAELNRGR